MRIAIDGRVFMNDSQRGIQRCFRELLTRLGSIHEVCVWTPLPALVELPKGVTVIGPGRSRYPRQYNIIGRLVSSRAWRREVEFLHNCDLFHSTFFSLPPLVDMRSVVTVHDMIPEQYPDIYCGGKQHVEMKLRCMEHARLIIAISNATAEKIRAYYPAFSSKLRVVHHGADHLPRCEIASESEKPEQTVLYVGEREGYKNFRNLLDATNLAEWPSGYRLSVVGKPFQPAENLLIERMALRNTVTHLGSLSDQHLTKAYRRSACFVFPSLDEGFGIPTLEAQAMGCPVACSDRPVFREIAGDGAEYFNPHLPQSIASAVRRVISPCRRNELIKMGMRNVPRFRWDQCAVETSEVYLEALA